MTPLLDILGRPHKNCNKCGLFLPSTKYHKHPATADKLQPICKKCKRAEDKARYEREKKAAQVGARRPLGEGIVSQPISFQGKK